tara:strand:- start:612 stop:1019 length:408 start_codon:yes stop_codon:yes gene_type:complete
MNLELVERISALLHGPGEPMVGSTMTNNEALEYAHATSSGAPFCLVRDWIWIDLDGPESQHDYLAQLQLQPVILFAHTVVYDSSRRWDVGDFVRTTPLHAFTDGFVFRTLNTNYVLLGDGLRKLAHPETIAMITG